jgi:uncharacterized protein (DUF433 family)
MMKVGEMEKLDRITVNPDVCIGQPTIRGMRITVSVILKMLGSGKSTQAVLEAYPELEAEDVQQSLKYAAWVVSEQIYRMPVA